MSKDSSTLTQLATWNPARGVWETNQQGLMCGHLEPYSRTWPISGSMRNGVVWERPTLEPPTVATGSSSSPGRMFDTPDTMPEAPNTGSNRKAQVAGLGNQVRSLLPTPVTRDHKGHNQRRDATCLTGALLPTPTASEGNGPGAHGEGGNDLRTTVSLLPTPRATEGTHGGPNQRGSKGDLTMSCVVHTDFGDYAPAITRWEAATGRPAPPATEPGPRGNPRLSPAFVEWMMGLPAGHVTNTGISRVAQLTALGNGVVPLQAAAAIRLLLERATQHD